MKKIIFAIHDLTRRGGQDRSTLEVFQRFTETNDGSCYVYDFEGTPATRGKVHKIRPHIKRPVLLKSIYYYLYTMVALWRARKKGAVVQATGACSLVADIIQVQFIHRAWHEIDKPSSFYHTILRQFDLLMERLIFRRDRHYIAISNRIRDELKQYFGIADNVTVIHHGVDLQAFHPAEQKEDAQKAIDLRKQHDLPENAIVVLLVGAYERKGIDCAVNAVIGLPEAERARVRFVAVGSGDHEGLNNRYAHQNFLFLPNQQNIADYYRMADIFLLPTKYEPFGLVILEAMASALPCIVSDQAGASELIVDGYSGYVIGSTTDDKPYSDKLSKLINDTDFRLKMGKRAYEKAQGHDWKSVTEQYCEVYRGF